MTTMDYSYIQFRFIKSDASSKKDDDTLDIKRNKNMFLWVYREHKHKTAQWIHYEDSAATMRALERMFHLLSWDEDPYENIQVIAPGFPMVMLSAKHIGQSWEVLKPFLEGIFENWPLNMLLEDVPSADDDKANPVLDESDEDCECDDCECEEESEEDEEESENEEEESKDEEEEEEGEIAEDDASEKTDPDMPPLVAPEDELSAEDILRLMRRRWAESDRTRYWGGEGDSDSTWANPLRQDVRQATSHPLRESPWLQAAEERQRTEPIEVRRVTMTPNGPRTHLRFV
jgi:hypothetical protein